MKRNGGGPTWPADLPLQHEEIGEPRILGSPGAFSGMVLRRRPALLVELEEDIPGINAASHLVTRGEWQRQAFLPFPQPEDCHHSALPPIFGESGHYARSDSVLADPGWTPTLVLAPARGDPSEWGRFHRFVSLSVLGWAFVLAAVCWELFAVAFSRRAGWSWDGRTLLFAWGLGILVFGFYQRTGRQRSVVSSLFLGVNMLMLGVLSLVVAMR